MKYWLFKSEPNAYSIDDLARDKKTHWDGTRNYQVRIYMRQQMEVGDKILFYHSNAEPPAIVGLAEVASKAYPDHTAFDPNDHHYDPKSDPENPTWFMVDVAFVAKFDKPLTLLEIKADPELSQMMVAQKGSRLSIQPVEKEHYDLIVKRAEVE